MLVGFKENRDSHIESVYYEFSAEEIYATYTKGWNADEILEMDRDEIFRHLLVNHGLPADAAEFAADQILLAAARFNGESQGRVNGVGAFKFHSMN